MPDREKVIRAIEIHFDLNSDCEGCAYENGEQCFKKMATDALTLLREQDTVEHALDVLRANGWKDDSEVTGDA
jgi:hypothetical protein